MGRVPALLLLAVVALAGVSPIVEAQQGVVFEGYYVWDPDYYWGQPSLLGRVEGSRFFVGYSPWIAGSPLLGTLSDYGSVFLVFGEPGDYSNASRLAEYLAVAAVTGVAGVVLDVEFWLLPGDLQGMILDYRSSLEWALNATGYNGTVILALTPVLLFNDTLWNALGSLVSLAGEVHWMAYTDNTEYYEAILDRVAVFHGSLAPGVDPAIVLNLGSWWPDPGLESLQAVGEFVNTARARGLSRIVAHDITGYLVVVEGLDLYGRPGHPRGGALLWVDNTTPGWNWLARPYQGGGEGTLEFTLETLRFNTTAPTGTLWVAGFLLEAQDGTPYYLYAAYSPAYGLRLELYSDTAGLVYASTWSHPLYGTLHEGPHTVGIELSGSQAALTLDRSYRKTADLGSVAPNLSIVGVFINALSSPSSQFEGLVDSLVVEVGGTREYYSFDDLLLPTGFDYYERGDDGDPASGLLRLDPLLLPTPTVGGHLGVADSPALEPLLLLAVGLLLVAILSRGGRH